MKKSTVLSLAALAGIQIPNKRAEDKLIVFATYLAQEGRREREAKVVRERGLSLVDWSTSQFSPDIDAMKAFAKSPEEIMPDALVKIWTERRKDEINKFWPHWTKFYQYYSGPDCKRKLKRDWPRCWLMWITKG